jgi:hypothetical protein
MSCIACGPERKQKASGNPEAFFTISRSLFEDDFT